MQNEVNFGGRKSVQEYVSVPNTPLGTTEGFEVFSLRKQRSDKGVARGPREVKPVKAKAKSKPAAPKTGRGPGRPRVYDGQDRRIIAAALKKLGYTKGLEFLRKERKLDISMTVARDVAKDQGITFKRGRPAA